VLQCVAAVTALPLFSKQDYVPAAEQEMITKAYNFAEMAHSGQLRKSKKSFFSPLPPPLFIFLALASVKIFFEIELSAYSFFYRICILGEES